ncbi:PrgI family protein [Actinomadura spongiicola]|uniref:PrgI family protein n=1 Tax=Actinomadura spongiicola TaxID=2303421 RepID=A0A372GKU9_9ACTN|nr:PrgI family protein [Actinomadura spongiicola]RFS85985.1 PrgI family protein [Actinomadura spongiicola]
MNDAHEPLSARIPADIEQPDKIMYGLTGRQVAILGTTAVVTVSVFMAAAPVLPVPIVVGLCFPLVAAGCSLALGRRDGMSLDRFALAALEHLRRRRTLVCAPEGVSEPPAWCQVRGRLPGPLRFPVRAIRQDGVMELDGGGTAALVRAGTISLGLRTAAEQTALVGFFGRWLNSLESPVQIVVQARPVDLSELTDRVVEAASGLPHPALRQAAEGHAAYLAELGTSRNLLVREVLIVLRDQPATPGTGRRGRGRARQASAVIVARRAVDTVRALTGFGVTAQALDADECVRVLSEAFSPSQTRPFPAADLDQPVTGDHTTEGPQT